MSQFRYQLAMENLQYIKQRRWSIASLLQESRLLCIYYVNVIWPRGFSASALILN